MILNFEIDSHVLETLRRTAPRFSSFSFPPSFSKPTPYKMSGVHFLLTNKLDSFLFYLISQIQGTILKSQIQRTLPNKKAKPLFKPEKVPNR